MLNPVFLGAVEAPALNTNAPTTLNRRGAAVDMESYIPDDRRELHRQEMTPIKSRTPLHIAVTTHESQGYDASGNEIGDKQKFSLALHALPDTTTVAAYTPREDGGVNFWMIRRPRPVLQARPHYQTSNAIELETLHLEAIRTHIRRQSGELTADQAATAELKRLGISVVASPQPLGGLIYPFIKFSPQADQILAAEIIPPDVTKRVHHGKQFEQTLRLEGWDLAGINAAFAENRLTDLTTFVAANRLMRQLGIIPIEVPKLELRENGILQTALTTQEVRTLLDPNSGSSEAGFNVKLVDAKESNPPIIASAFMVDNKNSAGEQLSDFTAEGFFGDALDTLHIAGIFKSNGKVHVIINQGRRWAVSARMQMEHPVFDYPNPVQLESTFATLGSAHTLAQRAAHGKHIVENNTGLAPIGEPLRIGGGAYSGSHHAGVMDLWIQELNPEGTLKPGNVVVELDTLKALADEGLVRSLPLLALTESLSSIFPTEQASPSPRDVRRRSIYNRYIATQPAAHRYAYETNPEEFNFIYKSIIVRRVLEALDNNYGFFRQSFGVMNKFSALTVQYGVPDKGDSRRSEPNLVHDCLHSWAGEPVVNNTGNTGETKRKLLDAEIVISIISDCLVTLQAGTEHIAKYTWRGHMPLMFRALGVAQIRPGSTQKNDDVMSSMFREHGFDSAELIRVYESMEGKGVIPPEIVKHPDYHKYRHLLVGRLLKHYVLDQLQGDLIVENFAKNEEVKKAVLKLCYATDDLDEYERRIDRVIPSLMEQSHGIHALRVAFGNILCEDVRMPGLFLAYLKQQLLNKTGQESLIEEVEANLQTFYRACIELKKLIGNTRTIGPSPENLDKCEAVENMRTTELLPMQEFICKLANDTSIFTPEEIAKNNEMLPYLPDLNVDKDLTEDLRELERASFVAAGEPYPYEDEGVFPFPIR